MGAALVFLLVALGALAAGVLIGRYYVPDDRQLRRTARHARAYMRALGHLIARDNDTVIDELRTVVEENVDDVEPYFALGALFRTRGEHERAIRVHQALALRERDHRKLRHRAMYELGLDFRAAAMPRRATKAMEEVLLDDPGHEGALRALASLYEEQARFAEAAGLWQRLGKRRGEDMSRREHHLLVAAAQAALARDEPDSAKQFLKAAQKLAQTPHFFAAAAELAAARGNAYGTKERLRQALLADPALAPHLVPGLLAAETGADQKATARAIANTGDRGHDELAEPATPLQLPAGGGDAQAGDADDLDPAPTTPPAAPVTTAPTERVLATLADIEAQTGPRLEIALIRARLTAEHAAEPALAAARADVTAELAKQFPDALAARVATARQALAGGDDRAIRAALDALAGDRGALAWALTGRWQCSYCGARPAAFGWRCAQCRQWGTLRMETGIEPAPAAPRERRAEPRSRINDVVGLLGATPDAALPAATLDSGLTDDQLRVAGTRRSLLGRVGGWFSNAWRR